jgi:hypothetical protein
MTPIPELIARLKSAIHDESVLISPRTSKLIEECKFVVGVLEGMGGLPTAEVTGAMIEAGARAIHEIEGTGDCDDLMQHPAAKSWDPPTLPRWTQWNEIADACITAALATGRSPSHPTSEGV